jgi:Phosphoesterase family
MPPGLDQLEHIVVLMMENRSFDHMLGSLTAVDARIDGLKDTDPGNPDTEGNIVKPQQHADFQGQLDPDPDHHFPAVDLQIFGGQTRIGRATNMQGFIKSYFNQRQEVWALTEDHVLLQAIRSSCANLWRWNGKPMVAAFGLVFAVTNTGTAPQVLLLHAWHAHLGNASTGDEITLQGSTMLTNCDSVTNSEQAVVRIQTSTRQQ